MNIKNINITKTLKYKSRYYVNYNFNNTYYLVY